MSIKLVLMMGVFIGAFSLLQAFKCGEEPEEFEPREDAQAGTLNCCEELNKCESDLLDALQDAAFYREIAENCVCEEMEVRK